jgi:hypothetical protein
MQVEQSCLHVRVRGSEDVEVRGSRYVESDRLPWRQERGISTAFPTVSSAVDSSYGIHRQVLCIHSIALFSSFFHFVSTSPLFIAFLLGLPVGW